MSQLSALRKIWVSNVRVLVLLSDPALVTNGIDLYIEFSGNFAPTVNRIITGDSRFVTREGLHVGSSQTNIVRLLENH